MTNVLDVASYILQLGKGNAVDGEYDLTPMNVLEVWAVRRMEAKGYDPPRNPVGYGSNQQRDYLKRINGNLFR
jgi:hypothetical protein